MMKIQKIMGRERYQVLSDDNRPLCIVEMGSAASVIEMRAIKDAILGIDNTDLLEALKGLIPFVDVSFPTDWRRADEALTKARAAIKKVENVLDNE